MKDGIMTLLTTFHVNFTRTDGELEMGKKTKRNENFALISGCAP